MNRQLVIESAGPINLEYYSDKAILPVLILETFLSTYDNNNLPSVLIFRIKNADSDKSCLIGVLEFTANEGTMVVPGIIKDNLDLKIGSLVDILLEDSIQKGASLTLKSLQKIEIENILDMKFFLEANLPNNYTTVSKGEELSVRNTIGETEEVLKFKVLETKPHDHISIINTSLDFDLQPLDNDDALKFKEFTRKRLEKVISSIDELKNFNKNNTKTLGFVNDESITLAINESKLYQLPITRVNDPLNKNICFKVKYLSQTENLNKCDLLISTDRFIDSKTFIWSSINSPELPNNSKELIISLNDPLMTNVDSLFFAMHMWDSPKKFIDINLNISQAENLSTKNSLKRNCNENECICSNCGSIIQKSNLFLHENFCLRNNIKCRRGCNQIFLRSIPPSHWHCDKCSSVVFGDGEESFEKHNLFNHKLNENGRSKIEEALFRATIWGSKLHECRFCHLVLPKGQSTAEDRILNLSHHENTVCGNKTIECHKCSKIITLKNVETHMRLHELDKMIKRKRINFFNCANINCSNVIDGNTISPDKLLKSSKLCETCYSQIHSTIYDPDFKKLILRIERKYVIQLTKGCGKSFCKNSKCVSSGIFRKFPSLKETLQYIKSNLMTHLPPQISPSLCQEDNHVGFWFCVNESITKRKLLSDYLYEEFFANSYEFYWICLAVSNLNQEHYESNTNNDYYLKVKSWLDNNAYSLEEGK